MADEPSLGEVNRNVAAVRDDLRALRTEIVRTDVYVANRAADDLRIKAVETDLAKMADDRSAMRKLVWGALLTAAGSAGVQLVIAAINNKP